MNETTIAWTAEVAFLAHQPPIDGGDGRIYVAGDGLAAIEHGVVIWCAEARDSRSSRDGSIAQQLATSDGASIVTPPAIGPDGSIWVATASHLCVAR